MRISFDFEHEDYVEAVFPFAEKEETRRGIRITVFLPYTETLRKIVEDAKVALMIEARLDGYWKKTYCSRDDTHNPATCSFGHTEDDLKEEEQRRHLEVEELDLAAIEAN